MKKILILALLAIGVGCFGQIDTVDLKTSYFGIPSTPGDPDFVLNEAYKINLAIDQVNTRLVDEPPHAAMGFSDSAFVIDLTQNVWAVVTNTGNDLWAATDEEYLTIQGDTILSSVDGDYLINASLSFSGVSGANFEFAAFVNGALASPKMEWSVVSGIIFNISLPFYVELEDDATLSLRVRNTASATDATMVAGAFTIYMIHPE